MATVKYKDSEGNWQLASSVIIDTGSGGGITPTGAIEITENGTHDVTEYATAEVNVPTGITPEGEIEITENGSFDVTNFASALVNVASTGADLSNLECKCVTITATNAGEVKGLAKTFDISANIEEAFNGMFFFIWERAGYNFRIDGVDTGGLYLQDGDGQAYVLNSSSYSFSYRISSVGQRVTLENGILTISDDSDQIVRDKIVLMYFISA